MNITTTKNLKMHLKKKKFELMFKRRAKAYSSSSTVV